MNVRIDYEPEGPSGPRRRSTPQGAPAGSASRKSKRKDVLLFGSLSVGVLALAGALLVTPDAGERDPDSDKAGGTASSAPGSPDPSVSDAPGLPRGKATAAGKSSTRTVSGLPRGFPRTQDGAVEAASIVATNSLNMYRMPKADRGQVQMDIHAYKPPADFEERGERWRSQRDLNDSGLLIDPVNGGAPDEDRRYTSTCHPELGAFKVENYTGTAATVSIWFSCITGVIDPKDQTPLDNQWRIGQVDLSWVKDDWRVTSIGSGPYAEPPNPENPGQPVTSYAERSKLLAPLGTGWQLFADATTTAPPEVEETRP